MYELIQVSDRSYYIQSPAKIGLTFNDKEEKAVKEIITALADSI